MYFNSFIQFLGNFYPKICTNVFKIYGTSGNLLKTVCFINKEVNYLEADALCSSKRMKLFSVDNQEIHDEFIKEISGQYAQQTYERMWINGKKNSNQWTSTFIPDSTILTSPAILYDANISSKECLTVLKNFALQPMAVTVMGCSEVSKVYCEL